MTVSGSTDFKSRLNDVADRVEVELGQRLPKPSGCQSIIMEAMRYAALGGGKRLRPFLMVETARMLGCESGPVWQVAAGLECLHVYSLIHDDLPCMDDDDLRRGKPTVHKKYDEAVAVLAGDGLLTHAFGLVANCGADSGVSAELVAMLAKAGGTQGMIGGQVIDISVSEADRDEALITQLQALKTGALIEYAVAAGALLGGANAEQVTEAFEIILSDPNVKAVLVNIFGGIMKCSTIAQAIVVAAKQVGFTVPLVVRLEGTEVDEGRKILEESDVDLITATDLTDAASKVVETLGA